MGQLPNSKELTPLEIVLPIKIPALGYSTYHFRKQQGSPLHKVIHFMELNDSAHTLENEVCGGLLYFSETCFCDCRLSIPLFQYYKITFDSRTGYMSKIMNKQDKLEIRVKQIYFWYRNDDSGVYVFRPTDVNLIPNKPLIISQYRQVYDVI